ncbi:hypothetical protein BO82DRAFT_421978, partial [Aspergillus uvarum CBS 121591]
TYDHRVWKTGLPVRSAVLKPHAGRLVVGWVTTSESLLLYVFCDFRVLQYLANIHEVESIIINSTAGEISCLFSRFTWLIYLYYPPVTMHRKFTHLLVALAC